MSIPVSKPSREPTEGPEATVTGSARDLPASMDQRSVVALTVVYGPAPERWGARVVPGARRLPINRLTRVFGGGPLGDAEISRAHAEVARDDAGHLVLRDVGSKNGTFVGERPVAATGTRLAPGDVVRVGETLLLCHEVRATPVPDAAVPELVGRSDAMCAVRAAIARYAALDHPVLVQGESGTGKELVAAGLAALRPGRGPFVPFNASAVAPDLVEAALFGHQKGAFTGATEARSGVFRAAHGGTLFLDEVGELPEPTQVKLLRAIEQGEVHPVGAARPVPVQARLVAATNRDLAAAVSTGRFRHDLYARLAVLGLDVPPLRARIEDVPLLVCHFLEAAGAADRRLSAKAMARLMCHPWPLNVRELRATVVQALADAGAGAQIDLAPQIVERLERHRALVPGSGAPGRPLDRETVAEALRAEGGNMSRAAARLGKDRGQLYRICRRLGIDPGEHR